MGKRQMDGRSCVICRNPVGLGDSISHRQCRHRTHSACMDMENPNIAKCAHCLGLVNLAEPMVPDVEPGSLSGIDYVENPLKPGLVGNMLGKVKKLTAKEDPRYLLSLGPQRNPIDALIRSGLGLQRFLEVGVQLDDFLDAGYKVQTDMQQFQDFRNPERVGKALIALGMRPDHLRRIPAESIPFTPRQMVEELDMFFPDKPLGAPLCGSGNWKARELVHLGWKARDLFGAGLKYVEQYAALDPDDDDERALGMTQADIDSLSTLKQQEPQVIQVAVQVLPPKRVVVPVQVEDEPRVYKLHHGLRRVRTNN